MRIGSIRMLRHFIAASQTGNIHRAAKTQSLTQSAITKSIKQLEEGLGVPLFDRSSTGVSLTSYGHALYARAKRVEAECELIEKELSEMASGHAGRLTIGAGRSGHPCFCQLFCQILAKKARRPSSPLFEVPVRGSLSS